VQRLKARFEGETDAESRVRIFILNHLEYFLANQAAMKVLSHEDDALKNGLAAQKSPPSSASITAFAWACWMISNENAACRSQTRIAVLSLFGMMNWIYTWHNPRVDADAASLASGHG
jgi:hypothetical protein